MSSLKIFSTGENPMGQRLNKTLVLLMVVVTSLGLLLSIFILVQLWRSRPSVSDRLLSGIDQTTSFLRTTSDGLDVIGQVVNNVYSSTLIVDGSINTLVLTIEDTGEVIDLSGTFLGEELITTITNTQTALSTAQASAVVIDNIMSALSKVPLIGIKYDPSLPLNLALAQVAESLEPIKSSLKDFKTNLETTNENMQTFNDQLELLDRNIIAINKNLNSSKTVIDEYQLQIRAMISTINQVKTTLPKGITTIYWGITIIIFWMVLIQISLLLQGIYTLRTILNGRSIPDSQIDDKTETSRFHTGEVK